MIRKIIRVPHVQMRETLGKRTISDRGQVADLLGCALRKQGFNPSHDTPARWGFGIIARKLKYSSPGIRHAIEEIHLGSSDPETARAIAAIQAEDLILDQAMPGWELDLRYAEIHHHPDLPDKLEALNCYCISPIRVTRRITDGRYEDLTGLVEDYSAHVNRTMTRRFGHSFHLQIIPDRFYVRSRDGNISAGFAVKTLANGNAVVKRGIVMPFTLVGPSRDIADAWYSGLGRTTALGFGMLEMQS